jgi:hypothetical protein
MRRIPGEPEPKDEAELARSLSQALRGAVFPLCARQLVLLARENDASASLLTLLSGLPKSTFVSLTAVQVALGAWEDEEACVVTPVPPLPTSR